MTATLEVLSLAEGVHPTSAGPTPNQRGDLEGAFVALATLRDNLPGRGAGR